MDKRLKKSIIQIGLIFIIATFLLFNHTVFKSAFSTFISITFPFILGGVIALFLNVLLKIVEKFLGKTVFRKKRNSKIKRPLALLLSIFLLILAISILFRIVIPTFISAVNTVAEELPNIFNQLVKFYENTNNPQIDSIIKNIESKLKELEGLLQNNSKNIILGSLNAVQSTVSSIFTGFLSIIFSVYLLLNKEQLAQQMERFLLAFTNKEWTRRLISLGQRFNYIFTNFLQGAIIESAIFGLMLFIPMLLLKLPYAATVSILIAVFQIIPYFGAFISGAIGFILVTTSGIKNGIIFLILLIIFQQIEANIIYPKVVGEKVGLPGIWVMVSVTVLGSIMGLSGMIIAVPIATTIYYFMGDLINYKTNKKEGIEVSLSEIMKSSLSSDKSSD